MSDEFYAEGDGSPDDPTVAVYGLGRFGWFWAELLARRYRVIASSRSTKHDLPHGVTFVPFADLFQADAIFLCVAISSMPTVLDQMRSFVRGGQIVFDTCSVKMYPVDQMLTRLPDSVSVIATHPMFGPDSARERGDRLPIITWPARCDSATYTSWLDRFRQLGMRVLEKPPEEHDREAAYTQGVTHYIGRLLSRMELPASEMATLGYRRLQQVVEQTCNDPVQLFQDLQRFNPFTKDMRLQLEQAQQATESMLTDGDST